jgi:sulfonate transport system permease protein
MNISKKSKAWIGGSILPLILFLIWQYTASTGYIAALILPSPEIVIKTFITQFTEKDLFFHILASFKRVLTGFLIGTAAGFSFGLLIGLSRSAEKIFSPFFNVVRQVSIIGWIPLIVMWFGMTELSRIIIISVAAFYPIALNTFAGVRNVPKEYIELSAVYGYRGLNRIKRIVLPAALPSITTGVTLALGMSWAILMAAEIFIQTKFGIGTRIEAGRGSFNMALVLVGIFIVGSLGFTMTTVVEKFANSANKGSRN